MNTYSSKTQENKNQTVTNHSDKLPSNSGLSFGLENKHDDAIHQNKEQRIANNSPQVQQFRTYQTMANNSQQVNQLKAYQMMADNYTSSRMPLINLEKEPLQGKFKTAQKQAMSSNIGTVIQAVTKESVSGWERFNVQKSDLGQGSGTTKTTRAYVNSGSVTIPSKILFAYQEIGTGQATAMSIDNPTPTLTYKSGSYWDAGHKLGRQNGGSGSNNDWVFPQTPWINQGNTKNMTDLEKVDYENAVDNLGGDTMSAKWRGHEDSFKDLVSKSSKGGYWWFKAS